MATLKSIRENLETEYPTLSASKDGVDVELTEAERKAKLDEWAKNIYDKQLADDAFAKAKADLLAKLGITEDEAKLLLA
jgi:hypothetical protein